MVTIKGLEFELNVTISGSVSEGEGDLKTKKRYGWLFFFSQINDYSVLYSLDAFLKKKIYHIFPKMEDSQFKKIHSFVDSFRDVKFRTMNSHNIFYPDRFTVSKQKKFLLETFNIKISAQTTDEEVNELFNKKIFQVLRKNEKDLTDFS